MGYTRVIIDETRKHGCPECITFRMKAYKSENKKHWQLCKIHVKCVQLQHLTHQPKTEGAIELHESAAAHMKALADIETEDGSIERELHKAAETRYSSPSVPHNADTCADMTHDYCQNKQDEAELTVHTKEVKPIQTTKEVLALLFPLTLKARAACRGK